MRAMETKVMLASRMLSLDIRMKVAKHTMDI